jgi:hypothetical protein
MAPLLRSNVNTLMPEEREVHPHHLNGSTHAARIALTPTLDSDTARRRGARGALARAILMAVATTLLTACGPNPNPNPLPRVPTPTPEPNRKREPPVNPQTMAVTSTQILVDRTVSCETHRW